MRGETAVLSRASGADLANPATAGAVAARLGEAIRTLAALPDRERGWLLGMRSAWPTPIPDFWQEFGRAVEHGNRALNPRAPAPTPEAIDRMLPTLQWLAWIGEAERKIVWSRAFNVPWWLLATRFNKSEKTLQRRHDQAMNLILRRLASMQAGGGLALAPGANRP
jgi:Domain of unknown function (DUF6362)